MLKMYIICCGVLISVEQRRSDDEVQIKDSTSDIRRSLIGTMTNHPSHSAAAFRQDHSTVQTESSRQAGR